MRGRAESKGFKNNQRVRGGERGEIPTGCPKRSVFFFLGGGPLLVGFERKPAGSQPCPRILRTQRVGLQTCRVQRRHIGSQAENGQKFPCTCPPNGALARKMKFKPICVFSLEGSLCPFCWFKSKRAVQLAHKRRFMPSGWLASTTFWGLR